MEKKIRKKSYQLQYLESVNTRTKLPYAQQQYLLNLKKGYEGEQKFDERIEEHFEDDVTVINDLLVSYNGSTAQIDTLLVIGDTFYLYEIKNYEGEFQKLPGQFRKLNGQEFICPSIQLNRAKKVLEQMISQWSEAVEIKPYVLFINASFTLFDAQTSDPFILPTQINNHLEKLKNRNTKLSKGQVNIVNKLQSEQLSNQRYKETSHEFKYEDMKKGIICNGCQSFNVIVTERKATCLECENVDDINRLILSHVEEIEMLFPKLKITTSLVYDWIDGSISKRRIGRFLKTLL
ncbi:nuclease-related domain-containing protein [Alkalibacterium sp. f15]|uniref:nuclease-related domain-containing protein n=1 Tax=Alkalibacterium sp. f15 TaxID=3414029 RepID=UPI003BF8ABD1